MQTEVKDYMSMSPEQLIQVLVEQDKEMRRLRAVSQGQIQQIQLLENSLSLRIGRQFEWLFAIRRSWRRYWRGQKQKYRRQARERELAQIRANREAERRPGKKVQNSSSWERFRFVTPSFKKEPIVPALPKQKYDLSNLTIENLKVATILDEFSYNCFKYELDLYPVSIDQTLNDLQELKPQIFFAESAWKGSYGQWKLGHASNYNRVVRLTNYCKENGIPTIFWCKEDPVHFEHFISVAKLFDYVFTTDENMVPEYKERCGHEDVYVLPFAAQPRIHNPIKTYEREDKVCFAGSYYRNKYPERSQILCDMLAASQDLGLDIYDRNYESEIEHYRFPDEFESNVRGVLPYEQIEKAYKGYKVNINVNTVTDSPTMFSRRVFESLASNTPMISNYSVGVEEFFGDLVNMSENQSTYREHLEMLLSDELSYQKMALVGLRQVLNGNTYAERTKALVAPLGIHAEEVLPTVLVVGQARSRLEFEIMMDAYYRQTFKQIQFLMIVSDEVVTAVGESVEGVTMVSANELDYNSLTEYQFDYLAVLHPDHYYGDEYLADLIQTTKYSDCEAISKSEHLWVMDDAIQYKNPELEYQVIGNVFNPSRGLLSRNQIKESQIHLYLRDVGVVLEVDVFFIDSFNFLECARAVSGEIILDFVNC